MARFLRLSSPLYQYLAWILDVFLLFLVGSITSFFYLNSWYLPFDISKKYFLTIIISSGLIALFFNKIYCSWRIASLWEILASITSAFSLVMLMTTLFLFLFKASSEVSRLWFLLWVAGGGLAIIASRILIFLVLHWLRRLGYNSKTLLLVGDTKVIELVIHAVNSAAWSGFRVVGCVKMEDFFEWTQLQEGRHPDEIWICLPLSDADGIKQTLNSFGHYCSNIRIVPDVISLSLLNHTVSEALGIPVYDLSTSPATTYMLVVKTILDVFLSLFIIALFSPLFFVIALAVKITSRGPVFYKQKRLGWNGVEIVVYKFRSMYFLGSSENEFLQASVNDKRVTSVGRFLRRTSLDELPQFFNVLQGRMSIVGPRPHAIAHNEHYKELIPRYMHRHKVMPGITGWAQINGLRGETDTLEKMRKRIEYDLYYIENMSLWLDLRIIVMTIFKGFVHKNAY